MKNLLFSILFFLPIALLSQQNETPSNTSIEVWNRVIEQTNKINALRFSYTVAQVHTPEDSTLMRILEEVHLAGISSSKAFTDLAQNAEYASILMEFKTWVDQLDEDFRYDSKKQLLQGGNTGSLREQLKQMKMLDSLERGDSWYKTENHLLSKFCKTFYIERLPEDPAIKKARLLTNGALSYKRKLTLLIFEASLYMSEFVDALNLKDVNKMIAARESLTSCLPGLLTACKELGEYEHEKDLYNKALLVFSFLDVFANNGMVSMIGLRKKIDSNASNDDIEKLNSLIEIINHKYNQFKDGFYDAQSAFLKKYVPKH